VSTAFAFDTGITNNSIIKINSSTAPLKVVLIVIPPYHLPNEPVGKVLFEKDNLPTSSDFLDR
jgi:hypothetical protein